VEDFPRGTARSVDGALHVRPGSTKKVTKTELDHLRIKEPWGKLIRVIKKVTPKPLPSDPSAATKAAATKAAKAKEQAAAAAKADKGGGSKGKTKKVTDGKSS
jgi:hypothetical protein